MMDAYQVARLRATKPMNEKAVSDVRATQHRKLDSLHGLASSVNLTLAQVGAYLYAIAGMLAEMGNKGYEASELPETLPTGILRDALKPLWEGILFYADGSKKGDYSGWGVRKNPHWSLVWMERYGTDTPQAQSLIEAAHEQALKENAEIDEYLESLRPKRMTETLLGEAVEKLTSMEVAHISATAEVLARRYQQLWLHQGFGDGNSISRQFAYIYKHLMAEARAELQYRADRTPPAQRTKKATEAMIKDWAKAGDLWQAGTEYFYSAAWIEQAVNAAAEPDFRVDYQRLPKQPAETAPVEWLSDGEMVREFMRWCDLTDDPNSFEYEDKVAMLDYIRTRWGRAKGQQPKDVELTKLKAAVLELEE